MFDLIDAIGQKYGKRYDTTHQTWYQNIWVFLQVHKGETKDKFKSARRPYGIWDLGIIKFTKVVDGQHNVQHVYHGIPYLMPWSQMEKSAIRSPCRFKIGSIRTPS